MTLLYLAILAFVQGVTEFLPVSSSGHLILLPKLLGTQDQGLALDVAVHVGTLGAVCVYFWADLSRALRGVGQLARGQLASAEAFLALCLIVATIPVMAVGLVLQLTGWIDLMRSVAVIGWAMIIFGVALYMADKRGQQTRTAPGWTLRHAVILGLWQVLALIPGTSRSGIVITGARALGYARHDAAKLSMLMSIPTILASGALLSLDVIGQADWALLRDAAIAAAIAFVAALGALALMMRLLRSVSFTPYVIYRIALGLVLLVIAYS
jgi:undecaprenyl-diphosphatase